MQKEEQEKTEFFLEFIHVYTKEQSCKVPQGYRAFYNEWKPDINIALDYKHEALPEDLYEVSLQFSVTAENAGETAYQLKLEQAGIFKIKHFINEEQKNQLLNIYCPSLVFPYVRKAIADLTQSAGFQALSLSPISFENIYQQRQANGVEEKPEPVH